MLTKRETDVTEEQQKVCGEPKLNQRAIGRSWAGLMSAYLQKDMDDLPADLVNSMMVALKITQAAVPVPHHEDNFLYGIGAGQPTPTCTRQAPEPDVALESLRGSHLKLEHETESGFQKVSIVLKNLEYRIDTEPASGAAVDTMFAEDRARLKRVEDRIDPFGQPADSGLVDKNFEEDRRRICRLEHLPDPRELLQRMKEGLEERFTDICDMINKDRSRLANLEKYVRPEPTQDIQQEAVACQICGGLYCSSIPHPPFNRRICPSCKEK